MAFNHRSIQNPSTNHRGIFKKCSFQSNQHPQLGLCVPRSNYQAVCFALLQNASCGRGDRLVGRWIAAANMSLSICPLVHEISALDAGCFEKLHFSNITWQLYRLDFEWIFDWIFGTRSVLWWPSPLSFHLKSLHSAFHSWSPVYSLQSAICVLHWPDWLPDWHRSRSSGKVKNKNLTKSLGL